jgi:serine phosphatase RsbU (regulator of sigma subunit)
MILGPVPAASFRRGFAHVDRGDTLVLVTDGVLERINDAGRMFGEDGVEKLVAPRAGQPAEGILTELLDACFQWGRGRPWSDDTSAIVISRAPTG